MHLPNSLPITFLMVVPKITRWSSWGSSWSVYCRRRSLGVGASERIYPEKRSHKLVTSYQTITPKQ